MSSRRLRSGGLPSRRDFADAAPVDILRVTAYEARADCSAKGGSPIRSSRSEAGERRMVDQIFTSSNPLISWLRKLDALTARSR